MFFQTFLPLAALLSLALASPTVSGTTCGSTSYSASAVQKALNAGCSYYEQGGQAGGSSYPHTYNNYEGFDFAVSGPYQEFPLVSSGAYNGGSPGADRVIFNTDCELAGEITHTGASGNNFVGCSGTS
ncbi:uncharacterized protein K452DRAFT_251139 [Aplosporella prunicola CBS 121167]|uniref:ribonuclease T1 n=1 Tax=Aplosporella prunicola CBS 121167 TaxID=1176127 RepID=A0A6A6BAP2_9PEZI|nr:uncharacterized protein K452DRAFT_251139 [Aplosporella prunicola CBS 121167]KAF2141312.1 hypothetical protein K452DRAFT_251139 [Aplosporella prunicola CBS 121167]